MTSRWTTTDPSFGGLEVTADEIHQVPLLHRVVRGTLAGSTTDLTVYLPLGGSPTRLLHYLGPGPGGVTDTIASGPEPAPARSGIDFPGPTLELARRCGAVLVESNQGFRAGGSRPADPSILTHRANAAVARAAARVARDHHGTWPEHAYLFGGSGGGLRTILAVQHVDGLWDGAVPYAIGHVDTETTGTVAEARRVLRDDLDLLLRLAEGEPVPDLGDERRRALDALAALGLPRRALAALPVAGTDLGISLGMFPPDEVDRYWRAEGAEPGAPARRIGTTTVRGLVTAAELASLLRPTSDSLVWRKLRTGFVPDDAVVGLRLGPIDVALPDLVGTTLTVDTQLGPRSTTCLACVDDVAVVEIASGSLPTVVDLRAARPGDDVTFDDRIHLAFTAGAHHRRSVEGPPSPSVPTGRFHGRMIHVNGLHDLLALPGQVLALASLFHRTDPVAYADRYRLWFLDDTSHYPPGLMPDGPVPVVSTRLVSMAGAVERALLELIRWVEDGMAPSDGVPAASLDGLDLVDDPSPAAVGLQPRVEVSLLDGGRTVIATAEVDAGSEITEIEWDLDGTGRWQPGQTIGSGTRVESRLARAVTPSGGVTARAWAEPVEALGSGMGRVAGLGRLRDDGADRVTTG